VTEKGEVWVAGTCDTKAEELRYVAGRLSARSAAVRLVDLSTRPHDHAADITARTIAACHPEGADAVFAAADRGAAVLAMQSAFAAFCASQAARVAGIIGLGGGGGTAMIAAGMRRLPYGVPKIMVSTLASGDVAPYVGLSDIAMMPSVTDLAGLNSLSRRILANAAGALSGMLDAPPVDQDTDLPAVGLTMFGVTTPAVTAIAAALKDQADCLVFHATGTGGQVMEALARDGLLQGLIDISTTEIADLLVGGVLPALPSRLDVVAETGIPYVGSIGALDMVNFWAADTIPERFRARRLHIHNANVTLMRTTPSECARIGAWIGDKLNRCCGPVRFLIPDRGVSALDIEGGPFWDPDADEALISALLRGIDVTDTRRVTVLPCHINDPAFARAAVAAWRDIART
jgi:uncharacterized protein (UPF0261 family)